MRPALASQALGLAALSAVFFAAPKAHAGLTEDLLARTSANKVRRLSTPAVAPDQPRTTPGCTWQPACTWTQLLRFVLLAPGGLSWPSAGRFVVPVRR